MISFCKNIYSWHVTNIQILAIADTYIYSRNDALDTVEEIIEYIDLKVPYPNIAADSIVAESVIRDFFSKFCYFIKVKTNIL